MHQQQPPQYRTLRQSIQMDPKRHRFHNKAALILTVLSFVLLVVVSLVFQEEEYDTEGRILEDANNNMADNESDNDFSDYSCRYIYKTIPDPGYAQCRFASTCNGGDGVWGSWVFCSTKTMSVRNWFLVISPLVILWMVLLFRLLGSTAEDYFSPSLEMFSVKLGLPPRFAGVSLLALGNGAADVSATMSAIMGDEKNGYKLSLGALSGAAMLVGGVIAGVVVIVAGGVPCRGALVRDVTALMVTVGVVWGSLANGQIGPSSYGLFLSLYAFFVVIVLVADVYHRAVILPRLAAAQDPTYMEGHSPSSAISRFITSLSNYDNLASLTRCGRDTTIDENGSTTAEDPLAMEHNQQQQQHQPIVENRSTLEESDPVNLLGQHGILHGDGRAVATADDDAGEYTLVDDQLDQFCSAGGPTSSPSAANWSGAFQDGKQEIVAHFVKVWEDVAWNGELNKAEKFLLFCELPFTVGRKLTVPIPCDGYYCRALIALSIVVSPFWFAYYLYSGHGVNLLAPDSILYFGIFWLLMVFVGTSILRYAPGGEGRMAMAVATPIALYGFVMAATWIDFVADQLVSVLDFVGIVLHIPGTIMGLTVLAWGNSMADLSANITMARKGLANMAMTACFAGPVFNILVGLGLGFSALAAKTGQPNIDVAVSTPIVAGFVFILLNCASILFVGTMIGKGRIESYYGYVAVTLYTIYVGTSIYLQFSKY
eukprot:scaffold925_cov129-Cylindrotheca_fusiformis.AAC.44